MVIKEVDHILIHSEGEKKSKRYETALSISQTKSSDSSSLSHPGGQIPATVTLGGGYYFIPPIPNKRISDLSEQFFT